VNVMRNVACRTNGFCDVCKIPCHASSVRIWMFSRHECSCLFVNVPASAVSVKRAVDGNIVLRWLYFLSRLFVDGDETFST
jgi:hypothetical protein